MDALQDQLALIRRQPAMFVGSKALFGFINYLVTPVAFLLTHGAKRIDAKINNAFEISSDILIQVEQAEEERISPFQVWHLQRGPGSEAIVLNALSKELSVAVITNSIRQEWRFEKGVLMTHSSLDALETSAGTILRFRPDDTIFSVTEVSRSVFESYFRRLSYLHKGVHFTITTEEGTQEYYSAAGISDLFLNIASPYQLMHEPIHIVAHEGGLELELVLAYHSWKQNHLWCFINNGRTVEGGTHEQGLVRALKHLKVALDLPANFNNGVIAVASMRYPRAVWAGCLKARIGNPELKKMVDQLVFNEVVQWMDNHPSLKAELRQLETFQFPEVWSGSL